MAIKLESRGDFPSDIDIYLSPYGNASRKLELMLQQHVGQDGNVKGYLDSYKSDEKNRVIKIDEFNRSDDDYCVIVALERGNIREQIMSTLGKNGVKKIYYVDYNFSLTKLDNNNFEKILYYIYDLSVSPLNYEYIAALCLAENKRIELGASMVQPVIVPADKGGVFDMSREALTAASSFVEKDNFWFLNNVLLLGTALLPSAKGVILCPQRKEVKRMISGVDEQLIYPGKEFIDNPVEMKIMPRLYSLAREKDSAGLAPLKSSESSLKFIEQWANGKNITPDLLVTITLRESSYAPERNSDLNVWLSVAENLRDKGFYPVFIRDTHADFSVVDDFDDYIVFHEASWNVLLRMAVYEYAYINLTVNTGSLHLCMFNRYANYIGFIYVSDSSVGSSVGTEKYYRAEGISIGEQYGVATNFQKLVWGGGDNFRSILSEFYQMDKKLLDA